MTHEFKHDIERILFWKKQQRSIVERTQVWWLDLTLTTSTRCLTPIRMPGPCWTTKCGNDEKGITWIHTFSDCARKTMSRFKDNWRMRQTCNIFWEAFVIRNTRSYHGHDHCLWFYTAVIVQSVPRGNPCVVNTHPYYWFTFCGNKGDVRVIYGTHLYAFNCLRAACLVRPS